MKTVPAAKVARAKNDAVVATAPALRKKENQDQIENRDRQGLRGNRKKPRKRPLQPNSPSPKPSAATVRNASQWSTKRNAKRARRNRCRNSVPHATDAKRRLAKLIATAPDARSPKSRAFSPRLSLSSPAATRRRQRKRSNRGETPANNADVAVKAAADQRIDARVKPAPKAKVHAVNVARATASLVKTAMRSARAKATDQTAKAAIGAVRDAPAAKAKDDATQEESLPSSEKR